MNDPGATNIKLDEHDISWFGGLREDTAVIIDMPGGEGVEEAIAFAKIGYRPVPLYNGVVPLYGEGSESISGGKSNLAGMIFQTANELASINIPPAAPPVFMLDTNRSCPAKTAHGSFDNRWSVFAQDMPSADFLRSRKIRNILMRTKGSSYEMDLEHVLYRYAEKKCFKFTQYDGISTKPLTIHKPSFYKSAFYRLKVMLGLRRNAAGGFGAIVPFPVETSSGSYSGG
jgi:hypothetical protein